MKLTAFLQNDGNIDTFRSVLARIDRPDMKQQLSFLGEIEAYRLTGSIDKLDIRIREQKKFNHYCKNVTDSTLREISLSQKLDLLRFDPQVVAAVRNGEKTGKLGEGIKAAIEYCEMLLNIKENTSKNILMGAILLVLSVAILLIVPGVLVNTVAEIFSDETLSLQTTIATPILLFFGTEQTVIFFALIIFLVASGVAYLLRQDLLELSIFRKLINPILTYINCNRSLRFLMAYRFYKSAGMPIDTEDKLLRTIFGIRIYEQIKISTSEGNSLPNAISNEKWGFDPLLLNSIVPISGLFGEDFADISKRIVKLLISRQKQLANRLAITFSILGATIAISTVAMIAYGIIFPMMSLQVGGLGQ